MAEPTLQAGRVVAVLRDMASAPHGLDCDQVAALEWAASQLEPDGDTPWAAGYRSGYGAGRKNGSTVF